MNIRGNNYCSKCFAPLPCECKCPYCGHDPEKIYEDYILEEGTLLNHQRYRIGVLNHEDNMHCCYGAWDYQEEKPVLIEEFFPKNLVTRDIQISDDIVINPGKEQEYQELVKQYHEQRMYNEDNGRKIIECFTEKNKEYHVFDIKTD